MSGVSEICKESGLKPDVVVSVFETILSMVASGEKVRLKGFGSFERKVYPGRTLTTPAVNGGEPMKYPDSYLLKFHQSNLAKRRINIAAKKAKRAAKGRSEPPAAAEKPKKPKKGAIIEEVTVPTPPAKKAKKIPGKDTSADKALYAEEAANHAKSTKKKPKAGPAHAPGEE